MRLRVRSQFRVGEVPYPLGDSVANSLTELDELLDFSIAVGCQNHHRDDPHFLQREKEVPAITA